MTMSVGRGSVCPMPENILSKTGMTKIIRTATTIIATPTMVEG
jgi:hypothetical protein